LSHGIERCDGNSRQRRCLVFARRRGSGCFGARLFNWTRLGRTPP
jgi:hypothetical protein